MSLIINDNNLKLSSIHEFKNKVRAILLDSDKNVLIAYYGGVILFPGGGIDYGESASIAIMREFKEEIGISYKEDELEYLNTVSHYQDNYPCQDGHLVNRLITTHYYVGEFKGIKRNNQKLTINEKTYNFKLDVVPFEQLEELVLNNPTDNPRNRFFIEEIKTILKEYHSNYSRTHILRKGKKDEHR